MLQASYDGKEFSVVMDRKSLKELAFVRTRNFYDHVLRTRIEGMNSVLYLAYSSDNFHDLKEAFYLDEGLGQIFIPEVMNRNRCMINLSDSGIELLQEGWPEEGVCFDGISKLLVSVED